MQNNTLLILVLLLRLPWHVAAQEGYQGNSSSGGTGVALTPSTVIIIIMAIIFLFIGCLAVFLRRFADGCFGLHIIPTNYPDSIPDGRLVNKGLDADLIKSLPTYLYADVKQHRKLGQIELECAVCLNEFQDPEALRLLPGCSHVFHPRCIDRWLAGNATCPVCRQSLLETEDELGKQPPHIIINITEAAAEEADSAAGQEVASSSDDDNKVEGVNGDDAEDVEKKRVIGKFSRSHSTGHSIRIMGSAERYTLELPAEYGYKKNNIARDSRLRKGLWSASCMASPKTGYNCGWFPRTPPLKTPNFGSRSFRTLVTSGLCKSSSAKNLAILDRAGRQLV